MTEAHNADKTVDVNDKTTVRGGSEGGVLISQKRWSDTKMVALNAEEAEALVSMLSEGRDVGYRELLNDKTAVRWEVEGSVDIKQDGFAGFNDVVAFDVEEVDTLINALNEVRA